MRTVQFVLSKLESECELHENDYLIGDKSRTRSMGYCDLSTPFLRLRNQALIFLYQVVFRAEYIVF